MNSEKKDKPGKPSIRTITEKQINLLPNNREAEAAILCCILLDNNLMSVCSAEGLNAGDFHNFMNATIYSSMMELYEKGVLIDFVSLSSNLREKGLLDVKIPTLYVLNIAEYLPAPGNIKYFIKAVKNEAKRRKYISLARQIEIIAFEEEDSEKVKQAVSALIEDKENLTSVESVRSVIEREIETTENYYHGVKIQQRAVWGIVGATGSGKTEFALDLSFAFGKINNCVLFCEYEGTKEDTGIRIKRKADKVPEWKNKNVFIAIKPGFIDIAAFVKKHRNEDILIVIDYLQRFARKLQNEDEKPFDNLRLYVNRIYSFFDRLRADNPNVSVLLLMSMSKSGINEVSRQRSAEKMDLLNSIKESGDVQYDLDYVYAMLFSDNQQDKKLSRFDKDGKVRKYMHLTPIKAARIGLETMESVYMFDSETYSYDLISSKAAGVTDISENTPENNSDSADEVLFTPDGDPTVVF